jgi:hypothetical protein
LVWSGVVALPGVPVVRGSEATTARRVAELFVTLCLVGIGVRRMSLIQKIKELNDRSI